MANLYFITHPDVRIDPDVPVQQWPLSARGLDRMRAALARHWVPWLRSLWCSTERKAMDGAAILSAHLGLPIQVLAALDENDRSATGYLPRAEFDATADQFFAHPETSIRGWERAIDAQRRIVTAIGAIIAQRSAEGDVAVVAHGGVGTLLLCHLKGRAISRTEDQPANNGGNYFYFDMTTCRLIQGWQAIDR